MGYAFDPEYGPPFFLQGHIVTGSFAEGPFGHEIFRIKSHFPLQDNLGMSWDFQVDGFATHELQR